MVIGYRSYVEMVAEVLSPETTVEASGMRQEVDRCRRALDLHRAGKSVAVVSSGDAGVYGMAGLLMELDPAADIEVVPGITAAQAAAARLGAPLMNDFVVLSLSDLLTPREEVLRRAQAAAAADLVTCLYNPASRRRQPLFEEVVRVFRGLRPDSTVVGWVRNAYRPDEEVYLTTLGALADEAVDMWSLVIVGSSRTEVLGGRMVTRRGYADRYDVAYADVQALDDPQGVEGGGAVFGDAVGVTVDAAATARRLYVLGGTSYARRLAVELEDAGYEVRLSVATSLGAAEVESEPAGGIHTGRMGSPALAREITSYGASVLIDATHPYALEVSKVAEKAASAAAVPLLRAVRASWEPKGEAEPVRFFESPDELAEELLTSGRRAFFTVGAKGLQDFAGKGLKPAARVLPTPESVQSALDAGVQPEDLVAAYPPYDAAFTVACLRRFGCDVIVSKESGREGGLEEKLAAARTAGAELFVIGRPVETVHVFNTVDPLLSKLEELWQES